MPTFAPVERYQVSFMFAKMVKLQIFFEAVKYLIGIDVGSEKSSQIHPKVLIYSDATTKKAIKWKGIGIDFEV